EKNKWKVFKIPATRLAEELGRKIVANIVMLGFFSAVTEAVSYDAMKNAILSSVPKGTEKLNEDAFEKGYNFGKK
ncbi:MAG: 2-oxoacid:acceptor oxidoreductase family protein, partial [Thermoplasmata archaeon]